MGTASMVVKLRSDTPMVAANSVRPECFMACGCMCVYVCVCVCGCALGAGEARGEQSSGCGSGWKVGTNKSIYTKQQAAVKSEQMKKRIKDKIRKGDKDRGAWVPHLYSNGRSELQMRHYAIVLLNIIVWTDHTKGTRGSQFGQ